MANHDQGYALEIRRTAAGASTYLVADEEIVPGDEVEILDPVYGWALARFGLEPASDDPSEESIPDSPIVKLVKQKITLRVAPRDRLRWPTR